MRAFTMYHVYFLFPLFQLWIRDRCYVLSYFKAKVYNFRYTYRFFSLSLSFRSYASLFIRSFLCCCSFYDARRLNHCHQNKLFAVVFYVYISQILIVRMHQSSLATLIQCNENQLSFGSNNFLALSFYRTADYCFCALYVYSSFVSLHSSVCFYFAYFERVHTVHFYVVSSINFMRSSSALQHSL